MDNIESKSAEIDHRTAAEVEAEANAGFLAKQQYDRDNPTGDEDEDAFLRVFRSLISGKAGRYADVQGIDPKTKRPIADSYEIDTDRGLVSLSFVDPLAKNKHVASVKIGGDEFELSAAGRDAVWNIVKDSLSETAHHNRDERRRGKLRDFIKGTGE